MKLLCEEVLQWMASPPSVPFCRRGQTKDYCFMESRFGGHLLILKGYVYRRKSVISGRSYWNCCSPKCFAKGVLLLDGEFQPTNSDHNHKPDFENLKRKEKLIQLKKLALQADVPGQDLLEALQIKDDIKRHLALVRTWRRRNKKKKNQHLLPSKTPFNVGANYELLPSRIPSKEVLFHLGHYFRQDSVNPLNEKCKYWRCRVKKCKARAKTDQMGNLTILQTVHNHTPEECGEGAGRPEQTIKATTKTLSKCELQRVPAREATREQCDVKSENSKRQLLSSAKVKRETETTKEEKITVGMESAPVFEEANSTFCASENFSFDKLIENYCISHEFNESLNLMKGEQMRIEGI